MISICIPVFNLDISKLVNTLLKQIEIIDDLVEIILIDDFSEEHFKKHNRLLKSSCTYIELDQNVGRAKIRNLFGAYCKYDYQLFLDCDAEVLSSNFIAKYIACIKSHPKIVCGGRRYSTEKPIRNKLLRWKYGTYSESQSYTERKKKPNKSFMTNNFLIKKEIIAAIKFDERISDYGHEDTMFGYTLKKQDIAILHIDNPIMDCDIENNEEYLQKTELGIKNLVAILEYTNYDKSLIEDIALVQFYYKIKSIKWLLQFLFFVGKPFIRMLLIKGYVNLKVFNFYKLGIFMRINNN